jgi:DNA polymerase elongation subunit (family B)
MKREALCDRGLWRAKKNYILNVWDQEGVRYATPEMKIVGLEVVKSNTPKICRDALKKSIEIIFEGDKEKLMAHIEAFRALYMTREFSEIASPTSVHGIMKYDRGGKDSFVSGSPRHVKGSILYNEMLERHHLNGRYNPIYDGDKIRFLSLKMPNPAGYDVISIPHILPKEFGLEKYIDYKAQLEKTFLKPLQSLTELIGWNVNNEASLEEFV